MKIYFLLFLSLVVGLSTALAQEENYYSAEDTTYEFKDYDDFSFPFYFNMHQNPIVEFSYGSPKLESKDMNSSFAKLGIGELRLGYWKLYSMHTGVIKQRSSFFYLNNITGNLISKQKSSFDLNPEIWRAGIGQLYGFGYKTGEVSLSFYSSNSLGWSHLRTGNISSGIPEYDVNLLNHYNNTIRFGSASEGGVVLRIDTYFSLKAGYERSLIFPGYVFWEHMGSMLMEYGGLALLDHFVQDVNISKPYLTPIVDFILKNAFSYGLYSLRSEKMNWPFNGASPLAVNTFKFGVTVLL